MPTYEYACPKCGSHFEAFQKITVKPGAKCPKCGARATRLMSAGAGLVFKGSGFYLTDYGRSGQVRRSEASESAVKPAEKSETKSETKPETKSEPKSETKSDSRPDTKPRTDSRKKKD
jgi:putative FmdB family regulatory protein